METWQLILGFTASAVIGGLVRQMFNAPSTMRSESQSLATRISALETQMAVIESTKLTEREVRLILHEQLQPVLVVMNNMQGKFENMQGNVEIMGQTLIRIDARLSQSEKANQ